MGVANKVGTSMKAHCSKCGGKRNCDVRGHLIEEGDEEGYYYWTTNWYLLVCRGCEHIFAQTVSTNSEDYFEYNGPSGEQEIEFREHVRQWPAALKRELPDWFDHSKVETDRDTAKLDSLLSEVYLALDNDLCTLAAIGIRTCFDLASELLAVDPNIPFAAKLEDLVVKGAIREAEREHLGILVEAGSASAHRGWKPTFADLSTLMDVLEGFIFDSFVLPARRRAEASKLALIRPRVPARTKSSRIAIAAADSSATTTSDGWNPK